MSATIINALAVLAGTALGLLFGKRMSPSFRDIVMLSSGVVTLVLGVQMALAVPSAVAALFSILLGGFIGHALRLEERIEALGNKLGGRAGGSDFGKGFLNASLLFCTGSMSIIGSIEAGTSGDMHGGFLLVFLALGLMGVKSVRTGNFLPALVFAPIMQALYGLLPL